jgi:alpha-galactosidase
MIKRGITFDEPPLTVYEPIWCAWGFRRNFSTDQILNALPKVAEMGYKWAVLDDGFQTAEGDWYLIKDKFPNGDSDMREFVDTIHSHGMKAKLWWAPMAVDPGTDLIKEHEDYLLLNSDGSTQDITWWDSYYLCPAYKPVQDYTRELVKKFMVTWGFDGLKIDGQHLNGAPPCFNPAHKHKRPEESVEAVPELFKVIYDTALEINPEAVVEICPCGTAYSFFTMPYMNQPVASDPTSSWQIRLKGKTFKALMGPSTAYYGDHVELSDGKDDWASTVGVGGVIGTKFTWPEDEMIKMPFGKPAKESDVALTEEKEELWKKWLKIYNDNMLPMGNYLGNLYDIGFDKPETHVVEKDEKMYYSFYAEKFDGNIELRGLSNRRYKVIDYVNNLEIGEVDGPIAEVSVSFSQYLLIKVEPI